MSMQDSMVTGLRAFTSYMLESRGRLVTFFLSLLVITFLLRLWQYGWAVNDDGALYLYAARNFIDHGLAEALKTYPWAYYSVLVAYVDMAFFNNLLVSGWVLNFVFQCGQIYFFYRICSALRVHQSRLFWAVVLFIISISFHNFRNYLMRDQGFILFIMIGVYYSLICINTDRLKSSLDKKSLILFVLSFVIAALFRIEALVILAFGFLAVIYLTRQYLLGLLAGVVLLLAAAIGLLAIDMPQADAWEYVSGKIPSVFVTFSQGQEILEAELLSKYWAGHSGVGLFSLYIGTYFFYLSSSLSVYLLGLFYFQRKQKNNATILLSVYALSIVVYCLVFLFSRGFLVFRYNLPLTYFLTALSIILILSAAARQARFSKILLTLIIIVPLFKVLDAPSGSKRFLNEAQSKVEAMGLSGPAVYSNALQVSLVNRVDYKKARTLKAEPTKVLKVLESGLKPDVAVVYYGRSDEQVVVSGKNCLAYYVKHRRRAISVYVAKNEHCLMEQG